MTAPVQHVQARPLWEQRMRAPRYTLPAWAKSAPDRCVFVSDRSGVAQVYCWDRTAGTVRQVTDRAAGVQNCAIEARARPCGGSPTPWATSAGSGCGSPSAEGPTCPRCPVRARICRPAWRWGCVGTP